MKFLIVFANLLLVQALAGQEIKQGHKLEHHNHGIQVHEHAVHNHGDISGHKGHEIISFTPLQPNQVSIEIPSHVQQVVTQVSQHIPIVLEHQLANQNQKRLKRALKNLSNWQLKPKERAQKCDFICNPLDVTVCGYNGRCFREFESQCALSAYNCLNTQKFFQVVEDSNCIDISLAKYYPGDM